MNCKNSILLSLLLLHVCFLLIDLLSYANAVGKNFESVSQKLGLFFLPLLLGYVVILIFCLIKKEFRMLLVTLAILLIHMFVPTFQEDIKELLAVLTNVGILLFITILLIVNYDVSKEKRQADHFQMFDANKKLK